MYFATRRAILYQGAVAAAAGSWADYANSVLDSLLALEFRGAGSLASATLYGSTPSVVAEPGGGLVIGANGLECNADTSLNSGLALGTSLCVIALYNNLGTTNGRLVGANDASFTNRSDLVPYANSGSSLYIWGSSTDSRFVAPPSSGNMALLGGRRYFDGSHLGTATGSASSTNNLYIGALNNNGSNSFMFRGNISAVAIGTIKVGADADTVASELSTRMTTSAL